MPKSLKAFAPAGVVVGFCGLLAAAVIWLLNRQFDTSVRVALAVGVLGFALAAMFDPAAVLRWAQGRQARYGGNVVVMTIALGGILVILNYLVINGPIPPEWKRQDFTQDQANTLSPETLAAIKALPAPVKAIGFFSSSAGSQKESAKRLLDQYQLTAGGGKFTYEFHDPLGEPSLAKTYGVTQDASVIIIMGQDKQQPAFVSENEITGALIRLSHPTSSAVYFLTGHGERSVTATDINGVSSNADLLKKQNYDVRSLSLQVTGTVPSDARVLVIAGPLKPLTANEVKAVGDYLNGGGALVAMLDPAVQTQSDVSQTDPLVDYLTSAWGLVLEQDVIVDLNNSYFDGQTRQPLFPLNGSYGTSPITSRLQNVATGFPVARSVKVFGTAQNFPDITYTPLVMTDSRAWGEMNMQSLLDNTVKQDANDVPGPMNLGVSMTNSKTKARVVVYGDSDFSSNQFINAGANSLLFLNSVSWAALEESLINLTPKVPTTRTLNIVGSFTMNLIFLITVVVLPGAVVVLGVVMWFLRRRHI